MKKKLISLVAAIMCLTIFFTITCDAAHYVSYTTIATIAKRSKCATMQGMAVGSTWIYTAKIKGSDESRQVLQKTNRKTNATTNIKNSNGSDYFTYLGHANDMDVVTISGKSNLYIATMKTGSYALVRIKVDGSKGTKTGNFSLSYGGKSVSMSGLTVLSKASTSTTFLFKDGTTFYKGTVSDTAKSGTIKLTKYCDINISSCVMNGKTYNFSTWVHQGFEYYKGKIYVPLYNSNQKNTSVIVVYNAPSKTGTTLKSNKDLSFMIKSKDYAKFEIEDCGICSGDGKMYINTNRRKVLDGPRYDSIHYIKSFKG
jgi:hypothetical protein